MSSKKSNKVANQIQKNLYAKTKKDFIGKLKWVCDQIADENISDLIPDTYYDFIYSCRQHFLRFQAAKGHKIPSAILEEIKTVSTAFLKKIQISIPTHNDKIFEISVFDYYSLAYTLILHATNLSEKEFNNAAYVKSALQPLIDFSESPAGTAAWNSFCSPLGATGVTYTCLNESSYVMKLRSAIFPEISSGTAYIMELYSVPCEKITTVINNENRPAYRIGWHLPEPEVHTRWLTLNYQNKEMSVYIQSHAIIRLRERLEGVLKGPLHFCVYESIREPKIVIQSEEKFLIEFRLLHKKVGYLVATISDNKVIILTFLFLTHSGTPEGERLKKLLGLQKEDVKYLAIDRLSAFVDSDLIENEAVKKIFIEAGCEDLFDRDSFIYEINWESNPKRIADLFSFYTGLKSSS